MSQINHPSIVKLYEIFQTEKYFFLVMEYMDQGDLLQKIKDEGKYDEEEFLTVFRQVVSGLLYLHQNKILHRDIKLDNILLDSKAGAKICDFGISRFVNSDELLFEYLGTPAYLAPEIIREKGYSGFGVDVWSLGIMSFISMTGLVPFKGQSDDIEELN